MDREHVKGTYEEAKGRVKSGVGGFTGNSSLEAEGLGDRIEGQVRKGMGDLKDMGGKVADQVQDTIRPLTKELEVRISRNPTSSVMIAAGVGLLLGIIMGR